LSERSANCTYISSSLAPPLNRIEKSCTAVVKLSASYRGKLTIDREGIAHALASTQASAHTVIVTRTILFSISASVQFDVAELHEVGLVVADDELCGSGRRGRHWDDPPARTNAGGQKPAIAVGENRDRRTIWMGHFRSRARQKRDRGAVAVNQPPHR